MGARITTIYGEDIAAQIAEYAKASGVSKIVIGRSTTARAGRRAPGSGGTSHHPGALSGYLHHPRGTAPNASEAGPTLSGFP